ncbi:MAG: hypothetical protein CFE21_10195 [Bacteroidetes bacterium B1(2017)]|nr:MAG: hypothetical protein CFE21_10195 [Bacteroidetes bacterium B1(2017)]
MIFDVAIIGGGLAGLALAIDLRKRGHSILVIEKGSYPRQKVCGEYISMESYEYLNFLCPSLKDHPLPRINTFFLSTLGEKEFTTPLDLGGFGISRYVLEELLYKEALGLGVLFELKTKAQEVKKESDTERYTIQTLSKSFTARIVCNATGRKSNFEAKESTSNQTATNYVGVKYHLRIARDASQIEIHNFEGGYCGISNIEEGKSCLCYIVNANILKKAGNSIAELEKEYLYQNKNLKRIFSEAEFLLKEPVTISGIKFSIKKPIDNGVYFLGDSAGTIAPITGNGMSICLRSAFKLSGFMDAYLSNELSKRELIKTYTHFWNAEFSARIRLSRYFQKLSEYPFLTKASIYTFKVFPTLAKAIIKLTHGKPF